MMENFKRPPPLPATHPAAARKGTEFSSPEATAANPTASASSYFETCQDLEVPASGGTFRVYQTGTGTEGTLFVLHHGAGHTALSWALVAKLLKEKPGACSALSYDCRAHGSTRTNDDGNLSLTQLAQDLINVVDAAFEKAPSEIVLVGHSMGGAVVVEAATVRKWKGLLGVVAVDVVEGTAMDSLAHMEIYIRNRPASFTSVQHAIEWSLSSQLSNPESARVSVPSQLEPRPQPGGEIRYFWRTDLAASQGYWKGWFQDLSSKFLAVRASRLLILAGTDRLDTPLTIGQMQGKYQLVLYPESGHAIQEDAPEKVAATLWEFWQRNGPGKVIKRFPIPVRLAVSEEAH